MMKLSLMQALVATLNDADQSPIAAMLAAWGDDAGRARYVRASANFIFSFEREGQPYILRFAHASERTAEAIQAELDYLRYLAAHGAPVALPINSLSGNAVESIATPLGLFHAVVFEMLPGEQYDIDELSLDQFTQWGAP